MTWLPAGFAHPPRVDLECGAHLRPIRAEDVAIDYPAVMGSRDRLWAKYGGVWGWPPASMSLAVSHPAVSPLNRARHVHTFLTDG